jgi:hypothetical protein
VTHVQICRPSTRKISQETLSRDPPKSLFARRAQTNMILCMLLTQTHRSASTIVSHWFGPSVQNARGAKKRVLVANPDVRLYVIGAMPAYNVQKAPIALFEDRFFRIVAKQGENLFCAIAKVFIAGFFPCPPLLFVRDLYTFFLVIRILMCCHFLPTSRSHVRPYWIPWLPTPTKVVTTRLLLFGQNGLKACLAQCQHFVPFVASADGLLGPEAHEVLWCLSFFLAEKWSRPYSAVRGYINARLSLALIHGSSLCLRGSRVPADTISFRHCPQWDDPVAAFDLHRV